MGIYTLSIKNFKRRKLRSALTMLGVMIGVIALVLLVGIGTGLTSFAEATFTNSYGDITIMNSSGADILASSSDSYLSANTVSQIENNSQLYDIKKQTQFSTQINNMSVTVVGLNDWSQIKIANGTQGVVISKSLVDAYNYKVGSNITINNQKFIVTGITDSAGGSQMGVVVLNTDAALPLNNNKVSFITANTKSDPNTVSKQIEGSFNGVSALTKSDMTKQIGDMLNGILIFVSAIASIALLVGMISIINIMLVNVTERTREIGVLKAIGFTNREMLGSILAEAGFLGFLASVIGVVIAAVLIEIGIIFLAPQLNMASINLGQMLPLWLVVGVIGGATILSVLAGLYPAWRASRLNVVEALRYE